MFGTQQTPAPKEKQKSIKEALLHTASAMKAAFPSYQVLTLGDLTLGVASVYHAHQKKKLLEKSNSTPLLAIQHRQSSADHPIAHYDNTSNQYKNIKRYNPENASLSKLKHCRIALNYANLAYMPKEYKKLVKNTTAFTAPSETISPSSLSPNNVPTNYEFVYMMSVDEAKHLQPAFVMGLDPLRKRIVISVRGSYSGYDVMTDLFATPAEYTTYKYYTEDMYNFETISGYVHEGFLKSTQFIYEKIKGKLIETMIQYPLYAGSILCVGHSLGGAAAAILSTLLRDEFKKGVLQNEVLSMLKFYVGGELAYLPAEQHEFYKELHPKIEAITFASAVVFSTELSEWSKPFITSFVAGGDLIPRFSSGHAEELRMEVLNSKWELKYEKMKEDLYTHFCQYSSYFKSINSIAGTVGIKVPTIFKHIENREEYTTVVSRSRSSSLKEEAKPQIAENVETATTIVLTPRGEQSPRLATSATDSAASTTIAPVVDNTTTTKPVIDKYTKNETISMLYPAGDCYLFVEEPTALYTKQQEEAKQQVQVPQTSNGGAFSKISVFLEKTAGHLAARYGHIGDEEEEEETSTEEPDVPLQTLESEKLEEAAAAATAEASTTKVSCFGRYKTSRHVVRHVDVRHFSRLIFSRNFMKDHLLFTHAEALDSVIGMEEFANQQFTVEGFKYVPAKINVS